MADLIFILVLAGPVHYISCIVCSHIVNSLKTHLELCHLNFPKDLNSSINNLSAFSCWNITLTPLCSCSLHLSRVKLHIFVYGNHFPHGALIPAIQPSPDLANLSPGPSHLLSITPQTNWSVTPLSGHRLHFSSHPSASKHSFFSTVTFSAGSVHTFTPLPVTHTFFVVVFSMCAPAA